ncbi:hypothetical protein BU23DRAFT_139420 [Bimuria novae-zelandiae CBS 107.79]|uniref:Uncharacterized protein n=1 Tax=Bimuria novae-zelandiae CBS 107.79 TaxID=1447943 RepID=A0A6A5VA23_9PLEO|nr:hypothetical protein BU23DRAFT_139420 [Bimuria novae-zelandiae CBS 107.79]
MSASAPAEHSSGSGPDGVGDTTLFIATAASYASDGPTLPVIGGVSEHADLVRPSKATSDARPAKKRKTVDQPATEPTEEGAAAKKPQVDLAPLYKPWTFLPPELLQHIEKRLGKSWEEKVEAVVFTKNQNVKSGINRLKNLVGFEKTHGSDETLEDSASKKDGGLIAVSACSEGTTKLVGIVEMAKRIVGSGKEKKDGGEPWCTYTVLTGLDIQKRQEEDGRENVEDDKDKTTDKDTKSKTPVLTVWFSRKSIPEFKAAFGEQTFTVFHHATDA